MSSNIYNPVHHVKGRDLVSIPLLITGASSPTNPPTFVWGDRAGYSSGKDFVITRASSGVYSIVTAQPWPRCFGVHAHYLAATQVAQNVQVSKPVQDSTTHKWTFAVQCNSSGTTPADIVSGDEVFFEFVFSNSRIE